ncbi:MAG: manganese efflux pump MntP family protein [Lachnospiraceae bacterium]|nr:manganese efflux pump MntP family protein [Lachnospiraceae bacterium]
MNTWELLILAIGLSMDAFAVAICKGLAIKEARLKHMTIAGAYFGGFQALMPLIGYLLGVNFKGLIERFDHWIAFLLLALIGGNMLREALSKGEEEELNTSFGPKSMIPLAVATSIDALAVGVTFAFLQVRIIPAVSMIGITTFLFSLVGVKIGNIFGLKYKTKAEFVGGVILILIGLKILLEHLGILDKIGVL